MKSRAYIVLFIDTTATPPVVRSAGIYGEPNPTSELRRAYPIEYLRVEGETYRDAVDAAVATINDGGERGWHAWLRPLMRAL